MSSTESDTRERILKATWQLMEQRHGLGVRIEDIAKLAGVSRQAVYLHFGTRAALLIATARYLDEVLHLNDKLQRMFAASTGVESLEAYVEFWANYVPEIYGLAKALLNVRETDEAAAAAWQDRMSAVYSGCEATIRCLERDGVLAPGWTVPEAADFFFATISLPNWEILTKERGWTQELYVERIKNALKSVLVRVP